MEISLLISSILIISGIGIIVKVFTVFWFYRFTVKKWTIAEAEILDSEIVYFRSNTDADTEGWMNKVKYKFIVRERVFISTQTTKNIGYLTPIKSLVGETFKQGELMNVYYNPQSPKDSVLDNKFNYYSFAYLLFSVFAFYIALHI